MEHVDHVVGASVGDEERYLERADHQVIRNETAHTADANHSGEVSKRHLEGNRTSLRKTCHHDGRKGQLGNDSRQAGGGCRHPGI